MRISDWSSDVCSSDLRQERTEWHRVVIFNEGLGKVASSYLRKGSKVYLEGQIQTRKWTDQSGAEKFSTEIVLQKFRGELVLLDSKQGGDQRQSDDGHYSAPADADLDDSVPF